MSREMTGQGWLGRCGVIASVWILSACASAYSAASFRDEPRNPPWLYEPAAREYLLEIGDVFDLKFFYHPELNDAGVVVRPDGRISAPLVGDVEARGRTVPELVTDLTERYSRAGVRQPNVSVLLRKSAGLRVFVGGEVNIPGMLIHDGHLTVSRAILEAGGPKRTAAFDKVVIVRDPGPGQRKDNAALFALVDLKRVLNGEADAILQPYDIVFLPKSRIADLNDFVELYITRMFPGQLHAGFDYFLGHTTGRR